MPRAFFHDYHSRSIYHITMSKAPEAPFFGKLAGGVEDAHVELSPLGESILKAMHAVVAREEAVNLLQYVIMPDHIHMLMFITQRTRRALGSYIGMIKVLARQIFTERCGRKITIFQPDFYDRIVFPTRKLDTIFQYIKQNPYRLAVRRANPDYFRRCDSMTIGGVKCELYGNFQLMENPFKEQVVVHRSDSAACFEQNKRRWLYAAANGGVLVSPFISPAEKEVRVAAEEAGGKVILVVHEAFMERYRPAAHDFGLCCDGRLLIVSLGMPGSTVLERDTCLRMNALAREIAAI